MHRVAEVESFVVLVSAEQLGIPLNALRIRLRDRMHAAGFVRKAFTISALVVELKHSSLRVSFVNRGPLRILGERVRRLQYLSSPLIIHEILSELSPYVGRRGETQ